MLGRLFRLGAATLKAMGGMRLWGSTVASGNSSKLFKSHKRFRRGKSLDSRRSLLVERLEDRMVLSALSGAANANETIDTTLTPSQLASSLVGAGVSVSNVTFVGSAAST